MERSPTAYVEDLLPSDSLSHQLQSLEKEIDSKILAKQLQIADASFKTSKVKRNLKVFVSNTVEQIQLDSGETVPSWSLRVEGKLETYGRHGKLANRKLSHYFQSVHIEFEPTEGDRQLVEWVNTPSAVESDGFEVRRQGIPANKKISIIMRLANVPKRYKLSDEMASVLAMPTGSKPEVVLALWQYIKLHKLQESDEKKNVINDKALVSLFKVEKMPFTDIPQVIQPHLLPLDPVEIEYDLDLEHGGSLVVHDVEVELDDPSKSKPPVAPSVAAVQREIGVIDQRISECVSALRTAKATIKVLDSYATDPITCVNALLARQTADFETVVGDVSISREDLNKAAVFDGEDIDGAISVLLSSMRM